MHNLFLKALTYFLTIAVLVTGLNTKATAKSWEDAIADVDAKADEYWEFGRNLGAFTHLGTALNEIGIPQHKCAILGRMLGIEEQIQHLEVFDNPEMRENLSEDELRGLMVHAQFLRNWAFVARKLIETPDQERQQIWNLDCVGKQDIPANLFIEIKNPSASIVVDGNDVRVLGNFEPGFFVQLEEVILENPQIERVVLGSGGGSVRDAILTGLLIRKEGLSTTLSENCYSACPLAFLGGVRRAIWSPYPELAFHQVSRADGSEVSLDDPIYELIKVYVSEMGANSDFIMRQIFSASPSEFSYPALEDLCRSAAVTWVQRFCSSDDY